MPNQAAPRIERADPGDWRRVRDLRLSALADTPDAFVSTLAEEQAFSDEIWQARLEGETWITILASLDQEDLGLAVLGPYDEAGGLYSMWVAPEARGRGLGDALVQAVITLAKARGFKALLLVVADDNLPAIRLYARNGFLPTGETDSLPPPRDHVKGHRRRLLLI